jgi:hypothetical protein
MRPVYNLKGKIMKNIIGKTLLIGAVSIATLQFGSVSAFARCKQFNDLALLDPAVNQTLGTVTASPDQNAALVKAVQDRSPDEVAQVLLANGMDPKLMGEHPVIFKGKSQQLNALTFSCTQSGDHGTVDRVYYPGVGWVDINVLWEIFWNN